MNKIPAILLALILPMTAAHADDPRAFAQVISSRPVYGAVRIAERQRECDAPEAASAGQCRIVTAWRQEQRIEGYEVQYHYQGRTYTTRLPYEPGERLPVHSRGRSPVLRLQ